MGSIITTAAVTVGFALFRGAVSVIGFLLKIVTTVIRLILCVLPVTGGCILISAVYFIICAFSGRELLPEGFPYRPNPQYFLKSLDILSAMMSDLSGKILPVIMAVVWIAAVILAVPVLSALLLAHAAIALFRALVFLVPADLLLLILFSLIKGMTPFGLIRERFLMLFPRISERRDERAYHDWLRRHGDEFREDTYTPRRERPVKERPADRLRRRERINAYYGEEDDIDTYEMDRVYEDEYEGAYEETYEDSYDDPYEDAYDDEYDDTYDEREYEEPRSRRRADTYNVHDEDEQRGRRDSGRSQREDGPEPVVTNFNFFAGCRDLASVEKKYRSLAKIYHPDNQDGDTAALQEINRQYAEVKRSMR